MGFQRLNVFFATALQTSTSKLQAFFQTFQTKKHAVQVNKAKITSENTLNEDHFRNEDNHEYSINGKTLLWLILQIYVYLNTYIIYKKIYIYISIYIDIYLYIYIYIYINLYKDMYIQVIPAFFCFFTFQTTSCCFWKLRVKFFHSTLKFEEKETEFLESQ